MTTMANGNFHQIAFETAGEPDLAVDFCNWWIGDDVVGIHGMVDNFQVTCLDDGCLDDDKPMAAGMKVAIVAGSLAASGCLIFATLWYCGCFGMAYAKVMGSDSDSDERRDSYRPYSPGAKHFVANNRAPKPPTDNPVSYLTSDQDERHRGSFKENGIGTRPPPPPAFPRNVRDSDSWQV